ncbi:hypothetical protein [uncultured Friedmanniella sp.]|uniref:hypothetical protein n=1 Tax=uncultured Friedmanniella sp. TaxID=335381 RepID=UPI0035C9C669
MESLLRWREPAVVVLAAVVVLRVAVAAAAALTASGVTGPEPGAAVLPLLVAALALSCHVTPPTPHRRVVTAVAFAAVALSLVLAVVLTVAADRTGQSAPGALDLAAALLDLVVPVVTVLVLAALLRGPAGAPGERSADDQQALSARPEPAQPEIPAPPGQQPTWAPDVAAGAAWLSAGDAASGRPATGWGTAAGTGWDAPAPAPAESVPAPPPDEPHPWAAGPR